MICVVYAKGCRDRGENIVAMLSLDTIWLLLQHTRKPEIPVLARSVISLNWELQRTRLPSATPTITLSPIPPIRFITIAWRGLCLGWKGLLQTLQGLLNGNSSSRKPIACTAERVHSIHHPSDRETRIICISLHPPRDTIPRRRSLELIGRD